MGLPESDSIEVIDELDSLEHKRSGTIVASAAGAALLFAIGIYMSLTGIPGGPPIAATSATSLLALVIKILYQSRRFTTRSQQHRVEQLEVYHRILQRFEQANARTNGLYAAGKISAEDCEKMLETIYLTAGFQKQNCPGLPLKLEKNSAFFEVVNSILRLRKAHMIDRKLCDEWLKDVYRIAGIKLRPHEKVGRD